MNDRHDCLIAFGSNQGDSEKYYDRVCQLLAGNPGVFDLVASDPVVTAAIGGSEKQSDYLNGCIRLQSELPCVNLFNFLRQIETELGRVRNQRWASRTVDLDLLVCGSEILQCHDIPLLVPHPRMSFRRFVLQPANQIAGDLVHPDSGLTINELLQHLEIAEPRVGLVTTAQNSMLASQSEFRRLCESAAYQFHHFIQATSTHLTLQKMKLVVYFDFDDTCLVNLAKSFAGPTLRLSDQGADYVANELKAALDAMNPF